MYKKAFLIIASALLASTCSGKDMDASRMISQGISQFTINLYNAVRDEVGPNKNIFVSPYSISAVTAMVLAGARGDTHKQLLDVLHLNSQSDQDVMMGFSELLNKIQGQDGGVTLDTANRVYVKQGYNILESYQEAVTKHFQANVEAVDFVAPATRTNINQWVEEKTREKIKDLIPEGALDALTRLVLVNAIYFKGMWQHSFKKAETAPEPFHLSNTEKVDVQMMHIEETFRVGQNKDLGVRTLEMPYKNRRLAMMIVLPDEIEGLSALEAKLKEDPNAWKQMEQMMRPSKVKVSLPKFKIESSFELSQTMQKMGAADLFSSSKADLSGISGTKDLFASAMFHKAFIDVNEEGTEAAAATGMIVMTKAAIISVPQPPFVVDRPFMFFIRDNISGTILFAGSMRKP